MSPPAKPSLPAILPQPHQQLRHVEELRPSSVGQSNVAESSVAPTLLSAHCRPPAQSPELHPAERPRAVPAATKPARVPAPAASPPSLYLYPLTPPQTPPLPLSLSSPSGCPTLVAFCATGRGF